MPVRDARHARLSLAPSPADVDAADLASEILQAGLRQAVTVDVAARVLGCDPATVRALLRAGNLAGHRIGKGERTPSGKPKPPRGVRIYVDSIQAYQRGHAINENTPPAPAQGRQARDAGSPAHKAALARLRSLGAL